MGPSRHTGSWLASALLVVSSIAAAPTPDSAEAKRATDSTYQLKLGASFTPGAGTVGLILKVRINGGPPLRMLLDSGAQFLVLERMAAVRAGCPELSEFDLIETGAASATQVKRAFADVVQLSDLTFRSVPVLITDHTLPDGIQGIVPLSLFSGYLIRLDIPRRILELRPHTAQEMESDGAVRAVASNHLLFVTGTVNEQEEGFFLLDTGSAYNVISRNMARQLGISDLMATILSLRGGTRELDAPKLRDEIRLRVGTRELTRGPAVAIDLTTPSRYNHLEVAGLIGYPALSRSVLTVSYRDSLIRIDRH
jgi:predicted aspartyl protease